MACCLTAPIWTNAGFFSTEPSEINFCDVSINIPIFQPRKCILKCRLQYGNYFVQPRCICVLKWRSLSNRSRSFQCFYCFSIYLSMRVFQLKYLLSTCTMKFTPTRSCDHTPWTCVESVCHPLIHCVREFPTQFNYIWYKRGSHPAFHFVGKLRTGCVCVTVIMSTFM